MQRIADRDDDVSGSPTQDDDMYFAVTRGKRGGDVSAPSSSKARTAPRTAKSGTAHPESECPKTVASGKLSDIVRECERGPDPDDIVVSLRHARDGKQESAGPEPKKDAAPSRDLEKELRIATLEEELARAQETIRDLKEQCFSVLCVAIKLDVKGAASASKTAAELFALAEEQKVPPEQYPAFITKNLV